MNTFRIDDATFDCCGVTPFDCRRLAARLGGLARWVLRGDVLEKAAAFCDSTGDAGEAEQLRAAPRLPRRPGVCGVLFAADRPGHHPLLREAFALPVRWERADGPAAGPDIPAGLAAEAQTVLELLDEGRPPQDHLAGRWRLRLAADANPDLYDLSTWTHPGGGSGWGILTAAVQAARCGVATDPAVWASVAWDRGERRLAAVDRLAAKLAAAAHFGAETAFIAARQPPAPAPADVEIRRLEDRHGRPASSLGPAPVGPGGPAGIAHRLPHPRERRGRQAAVLCGRQRVPPASGVAGRASRGRRVLPGGIARPDRRPLPGATPAGVAAGALVTFLSGASELVELAVRIYRPVRLLVLHTRQTEPQVRETAPRLRAAAGEDCAITFWPVESDVAPGELPPEARAFARSGSPSELVLDLTPGTKAVSLAIYADLAIPGSRPVYLHTSRPDGSTIDYGTERIIFLPTPAAAPGPTA